MEKEEKEITEMNLRLLQQVQNLKNETRTKAIGGLKEADHTTIKEAKKTLSSYMQDMETQSALAGRRVERFSLFLRLTLAWKDHLGHLESYSTEFTEDVLKSTSDFKLVRTESGLVGMAHPVVEPGDRIFEVKDIEMPLVFRHTFDDKCQFIGTARLADNPGKTDVMLRVEDEERDQEFVLS